MVAVDGEIVKSNVGSSSSNGYIKKSGFLGFSVQYKNYVGNKFEKRNKRVYPKILLHYDRNWA